MASGFPTRYTEPHERMSHAAGLRIMASSDQYAATVADHQHLFDMGFDMVLSYNCENGVTAARAENAARGLPP